MGRICGEGGVARDFRCFPRNCNPVHVWPLHPNRRGYDNSFDLAPDWPDRLCARGISRLLELKSDSRGRTTARALTLPSDRQKRWCGRPRLLIAWCPWATRRWDTRARKHNDRMGRSFVPLFAKSSNHPQLPTARHKRNSDRSHWRFKRQVNYLAEVSQVILSRPNTSFIAVLSDRCNSM